MTDLTNIPMVIPHQPLNADECKVVEVAIGAIVKTFELDSGNASPDDAIQSLAAIAVQLIRRGCEPPKAVKS